MIDIQLAASLLFIMFCPSPMVIKYESTFDADIIHGLENIGHATKDNGGAGSVVGAIQRGDDGKLHAKADFRKSGGVAGF